MPCHPVPAPAAPCGRARPPPRPAAAQSPPRCCQRPRRRARPLPGRCQGMKRILRRLRGRRLPPPARPGSGHRTCRTAPRGSPPSSPPRGGGGGETPTATLAFASCCARCGGRGAGAARGASAAGGAALRPSGFRRGAALHGTARPCPPREGAGEAEARAHLGSCRRLRDRPRPARGAVGEAGGGARAGEQAHPTHPLAESDTRVEGGAAGSGGSSRPGPRCPAGGGEGKESDSKGNAPHATASNKGTLDSPHAAPSSSQILPRSLAMVRSYRSNCTGIGRPGGVGAESGRAPNATGGAEIKKGAGPSGSRLKRPGRG